MDGRSRPILTGAGSGSGAGLRVEGWTERGAAGDRAPGELLSELLAAAPRRWLRRVPGRETFVDPAPGAPRVVKRFRGGLARDWLHERLHLAPGRLPGRREGENLRALAADGLPVPRALAWCEEVAGPLRGLARGRSAVVMELVPHELSLRELAENDPSAALERWLEPLAELVARLHGRGWYHRDLYLEHVVVARRPGAAEELVLLDVGRARRQRRPRERWFVKDLAALEHSAPRAGAAGSRGPGIGPRARLRFLARYLDRRGITDRRARRELAAAVGAKAARLAAHAPRFVDPAPTAGGVRP